MNEENTEASKSSINWTRIGRLLAAAAASIPVIIVLIAAGLGWIYTRAVLHPGCQGDFASLDEYGYPSEMVSFESRTGPTLRGWFSKGSEHPEIAIIVMPGHAGNTRAALDDAVLLARHGYSTLVFEHRSCVSPSLSASTGFWEAQDALGAVDYLETRADIAHIGAMGFSEGGTAVLMAAAEEPAIEAVVPMGGYADLKDDILDPDDNLDWFSRIVRITIVWWFRVEGVPVDKSSPAAVIDQISPRPVFLIYGELEGSGQQLYNAAKEPKSLWIVPGTGHGGYGYTHPEEYEQRVVNFFDESFNVCEDCPLP
jgi:dipeptidyl aminopeptidase/acylaminoacyl peptidase